MYKYDTCLNFMEPWQSLHPRILSWHEMRFIEPRWTMVSIWCLLPEASQQKEMDLRVTRTPGGQTCAPHVNHKRHEVKAERKDGGTNCLSTSKIQGFFFKIQNSLEVGAPKVILSFGRQFIFSFWLKNINKQSNFYYLMPPPNLTFRNSHSLLSRTWESSKIFSSESPRLKSSRSSLPFPGNKVSFQSAWPTALSPSQHFLYPLQMSAAGPVGFPQILIVKSGSLLCFF